MSEKDIVMWNLKVGPGIKAIPEDRARELAEVARKLDKQAQRYVRKYIEGLTGTYSEEEIRYILSLIFRSVRF